MTRTWIVGYWTVAAVAVFRILGHSDTSSTATCSLKRTESRVQILGIEWVKSVRETPMPFEACRMDRAGTAGRRDDGATGPRDGRTAGGGR